jgi:hypothetical protein
MFIRPAIEIVTTTPENDYACIGVDCTCCGEKYLFGTSLSGFTAWREGELIQKALPELPAPLREMLISGTCPECWDAMFKDCDDDEDYTL